MLFFGSFSEQTNIFFSTVIQYVGLSLVFGLSMRFNLLKQLLWEKQSSEHKYISVRIVFKQMGKSGIFVPPFIELKFSSLFFEKIVHCLKISIKSSYRNRNFPYKNIRSSITKIKWNLAFSYWYHNVSRFFFQFTKLSQNLEIEKVFRRSAVTFTQWSIGKTGQPIGIIIISFLKRVSP